MISRRIMNTPTGSSIGFSPTAIARHLPHLTGDGDKAVSELLLSPAVSTPLRSFPHSGGERFQGRGPFPQSIRRPPRILDSLYIAVGNCPDLDQSLQNNFRGRRVFPIRAGDESHLLGDVLGPGGHVLRGQSL